MSSQRLGAAISLEQLEQQPYALLAELQAHEPVSWVSVLDGWLVTRYDLALAVMRDPARFTVDDPRFSTAVVVGPSMLSLDGPAHDSHRAPFVGPFRAPAVADRLGQVVASLAARLLDGLAGSVGAELRRGLAGPLAASTMTRALGLGEDEVGDLLGWYDQIVAAVTAITAGADLPSGARQAFRALERRLGRVMEGQSLLASAAQAGSLERREVISNAAVLLFGGIETTEGMIANAALALLRHPDALARVRADPGLLDRAIDESLRLEPAAAVIDRYATEDVVLSGVQISAGDLVRISLTAANRDPAVFADPNRFDLDRPNPRRHLAFAQGPHVCLGVHLARLEARTALAQLLERFPRLRLDPERPAEVRGLVFRKPVELYVRWD